MIEMTIGPLAEAIDTIKCSSIVVFDEVAERISIVIVFRPKDVV